MNIVLISSLLGAFTLQVAPSEETLKVSVTLWPPGSNVYVGECVLLRCLVESSSGSAWGYRWFKHKARPPTPIQTQTQTQTLTPSPRHRVSGDSYSIVAVTREDAGGYRCRAERRASNATPVALLSEPAVLSVTETPPPSSLLTLTPGSRQLFRGERFTARCPPAWTLRRWSGERRAAKGTRVIRTDRCSPLGGDVAADGPDACAFTAAAESAGLYWCEGAGGRSNAVDVIVSHGGVILKTPASPVMEGDEVVLCCQYWTENHSKTTFFKDGAEVATNSSSSSDGGTKMTIENVTRGDEGYYKCTSGEMESPETWLSVRPDPGLNFTSTDGTAASTIGSWKWILISCVVVLLFLIPLTVWLARHQRCRTFCTRRRWPLSKETLPEVELPATDQEVTEVQWDLSWMEMSDLLDKQLFPGA